MLSLLVCRVAEAGVTGKAGLVMGVDAKVGDTSVVAMVKEGEVKGAETAAVAGWTGGGPRDDSCKQT